MGIIILLFCCRCVISFYSSMDTAIIFYGNYGLLKLIICKSDHSANIRDILRILTTIIITFIYINQQELHEKQHKNMSAIVLTIFKKKRENYEIMKGIMMNLKVLSVGLWSWEFDARG